MATNEENEVVTRSAPRWAWDLIDETLALDAESSLFDQPLRDQIKEAMDGMLLSSEEDLGMVSRAMVKDFQKENA